MLTLDALIPEEDALQEIRIPPSEISLVDGCMLNPHAPAFAPANSEQYFAQRLVDSQNESIQ
eukprot:3347427-Karenia_brevis.AAC.1